MSAQTSDLPAELQDAGDETLEEWFLVHLQDPVIPFEPMTAILRSFQARRQPEKAETCADLLHEALVQRRAEEELLSLLALRASWHPDDPAFAAVCEKTLVSFFQNQSRAEALLRNSGFDQGLPATECLRRFRLLRRLHPQALCYEKTWGFGIVTDIAEFDQQVRIDFERKKGHRMSLAYAAETLQLLDDDHILARKHRDPEAFAAWVQQDPAEVVKSALQSFGPLSAQSLQELMAGRLMPEDQWKSFWDTARKRLKEDPLVEFPARRNEPIRLLEREKSYDAQWLAALTAERDFDRILDRMEEWKSAVSPNRLSNDFQEAIENRLAFIIHGADRTQWASRAHAILLAVELGIDKPSWNVDDAVAPLFSPDIFIDTLHHLPVSLIRRLLLFLSRRNRDQTADLLVQVLPELALTAFNEVVDCLQEMGEEPQVMEVLRALFFAGDASPEMIYWLYRHDDVARRHSLCAPGRLALEALNALELDQGAGERLKAMNQLRSLLEQPAWLQAALSAMDELERHHFVCRLKQSPAWSVLERTALAARMIEAFPDLKKSLTDTAAPPAPSMRLTSLRRYRERQALLHKLIMEDIPRNSRDIATARSYGDLHENFEYKAACEMQGILMRRRQELESLLSEVKSTDFEGFPTAVAGMGTGVTLAHTDGRQERYFILGEWDSDDALGIISSQSKLAEALSGHQKGDQILMPTETGSAPVTFMDIGGLPDDIKAWIRGA